MAFHEADCTPSSEKAHIKLSKFLLDFITGNHVSAVAINAAGTGYAVNDVLTIAGGTPKQTVFAADAVVTTIGGSGEVTGIRLNNWGAYSSNPTATANAVTGGTGSGCTLNLTMLSAEWTQDRSTWVDNNTEFEWIAHGVNLSGANPYGGIQTATQSGIPMWIPKYMTGFGSGFAFGAQPGASAPLDLTADGPRVPLVDTQMRFFFFCSGRRFIAIPRSAPTYEWCHIGLYSPFVIDPDEDYPLPMIVSGTTMRASENMSSALSDLHAPMPNHFNNGQMHIVRWIDGTAKNFRTDSTPTALFIWPHSNRMANTEMAAPNLNGGFLSVNQNNGIVSNIWLSSEQTTRAAPAPIGVGGRLFMLTPCTICSDAPGACYVVGELEGVFVIHGRGIAAEDRVTFGGNRYVVFPSANSNDVRFFYAIREN